MDGHAEVKRHAGDAGRACVWDLTDARAAGYVPCGIYLYAVKFMQGASSEWVMERINLKVHIAQSTAIFLAFALALFIPAGTIAWPDVWVFLGMNFIFGGAIDVWLYRHNQELMKELVMAFDLFLKPGIKSLSCSRVSLHCLADHYAPRCRQVRLQWLKFWLKYRPLKRSLSS